MNTETILTLSPLGAERWTITKSKLAVNEPVLVEALSRNVIRKCPAVVNIGGPYGVAGVALKSGLELWSVQVLSLSLECPFYLKDGVHSPAFGDPAQTTMKMEWVPEMRLLFLISVVTSGRLRVPGDRYLIATDAKGNMWRLPVSNLYEDGKLCHGQPSLKFNTSMEAVLDCCKRFTASKWNHDLYHISEEKRFRSTQDMFRWKPEEKGFTQLPMVTSGSKDWTSLCQKISNEVIQQLIT